MTISANLSRPLKFPNSLLVKLHAHGAPESSHEVLLGGPMARFHQDLADRARRDPNFHYYYVTARQMYNLAKAAEEGWSGTVAGALDYHVVWGPLMPMIGFHSDGSSLSPARRRSG